MPAPLLDVPTIPEVVPLIANGSSRKAHFAANAVAIPLFRIVQASTGRVRFKDKHDLCDFFKISRSAYLIASGTAKDRPLEGWWRLENREAVLMRLREVGVDLITTPNYSLFTDVPRWDNLHSMKRIAISWAEAQRAGIPAALHINARTQRDYSRWAEFARAREQVQCVAVEFGTGAGNPTRIERHVEWICALADHVARPLTLVVRGGQAYLSKLATHFGRVVYIDTESFIKTQRRQRARLTQELRLQWETCPTPVGTPLDALLASNAAFVEAAVRALLTSTPGGLKIVQGAVSRMTNRRNQQAAEGADLRQIEMPYGWR
jgi:hypothetical protein